MLGGREDLRARRPTMRRNQFLRNKRVMHTYSRLCCQHQPASTLTAGGLPRAWAKDIAHKPTHGVRPNHASRPHTTWPRGRVAATPQRRPRCKPCSSTERMCVCCCFTPAGCRRGLPAPPAWWWPPQPPPHQCPPEVPAESDRGARARAAGFAVSARARVCVGLHVCVGLQRCPRVESMARAAAHEQSAGL